MAQQQAKIAYIDLETAPLLGYTWGKYDQNVIDFKKNWYILCFAVKWAHEKKTRVYTLADFLLYKKDKEDDKMLVKELWKIFEEANIIVAHNAKGFDIKRSKARFIVHGLPPPSPYQVIDTLLTARRNFGFTSNKLDDLGKELGVGRKVAHPGFSLWLGCMAGNKKSWKLMSKYVKQDVDLLYKVEQKLKAWDTSYPNLNLYSDKNNCPTCQSKRFIRKGWRYTATTKKQHYSCKDCGKSFSGAMLLIR